MLSILLIRLPCANGYSYVRWCMQSCFRGLNYNRKKKIIAYSDQKQIEIKHWNCVCICAQVPRLLVNIYFLPSKLAGSKNARFLAKNQLQSNEITQLCEFIHLLVAKKCQNLTRKVIFFMSRTIWIFLISFNGLHFL